MFTIGGYPMGERWLWTTENKVKLGAIVMGLCSGKFEVRKSAFTEYFDMRRKFMKYDWRDFLGELDGYRMEHGFKKIEDIVREINIEMGGTGKVVERAEAQNTKGLIMDYSKIAAGLRMIAEGIEGELSVAAPVVKEEAPAVNKTPARTEEPAAKKEVKKVKKEVAPEAAPVVEEAVEEPLEIVDYAKLREDARKALVEVVAQENGRSTVLTILNGFGNATALKLVQDKDLQACFDKLSAAIVKEDDLA